MSEWKEVRLGDLIVTNKKSIDRNFGFNIIQYLDTGSITCNKVSTLQEINLNEAPSRAKRLVEDQDIIYSTVRPNQLHYGFMKNPPENLVVSTGFVTITCNNSIINPYFLYSYLTQSQTTEYLHSIAEASTSAYPSLKPSDLESLEIILPPLYEQNAIAEVLSSLDDKIDLLHRQNKILEQMAETLFRQWFIEDANEEWAYVSLEDFVSIYNGVSYKSSDLNESKTAMITLKSFARNGGFRLDGFKEYSGKYKDHHIVREGDLVVAHTDITQDAALIGNPILVIGKPEYDTLVISMDLVKIETNYNWLSTEFLYFLMRTRTFKEHCVGYSNGSTVLHLSKDAVPSFEFLLPPEKLISEFTSMVRPMIKKINQNISHSRNLEQQRDTLLPKLMSGEVRVKLEKE
jgi:type I restriction enzyme S subunit